MAQIVAVRTEKPYGASHEHISQVRLADGSYELRSTVINNIRYGGISYWTAAAGQVADVVVRGCPFCAFSDYITTLPDSTTANNLLKLPRF